MKIRRIGNAIADFLANKGRELHADIESTVWRIRAMYKKGMAWATWVGQAAMSQRDPARTPDHDLPPENRYRPSRVKRNQPKLPAEAKVLRR